LGNTLKVFMRLVYIFGCVVFLGCLVHVAALSTDAMEKGSRELAGPHSIDCGRVGIHEDPKAATDCALSAFKAGKPFRVRYDLQGIDSDVSAGMLRASTGKVYGVVFDSAGMSNGPKEKPRYFIATPCPKPVHIFVTKSGRLNCFPPSKTDGNLMSPTFSPY
jgi:hypothetical protein